MNHLPISTRFGTVGILWDSAGSKTRVLRVVLPAGERAVAHPDGAIFTEAQRKSRPEIERLAADLQRFLEGERIEFDLSLLDWTICSAFQSTILRMEASVPRGRVIAYGQLARRAQAPGGARAAGRALAANPFPLIIPCHRAVQADGALGGFQGGATMKRELLEIEGVRFTASGRVLAEYFRDCPAQEPKHKERQI